MDNLEIKNAIIKSARISNYGGILSSYIRLDYGDSGQVFGGYALYLPRAAAPLESCAGHFIWRVMEIAGVTEWSDLPGSAIRVKASHCGIAAIGHIVKDDWFCPADDFREDKHE